MANCYVGISGWTYDGWKNSFYPEKWPVKRQLEYASQQVRSIEINGTFYAMQKPKSYANWYESTPEDFIFSVKAPRYITHVRRLKEVETGLANFFATGLLTLGKKLGPILWQFPPFVTLKDDRFDRFFELLPRTSKQAAQFAKKNYSQKIEEIVTFEVGQDLPLQHAFEFRHPSFFTDEFFKKLQQHGLAVVFAHAGEKSPYTESVTANFVYLRMHGQGEKYLEGYPKNELKEFCNKCLNWMQSDRDVFIYFDNDQKAYAPQNAMYLNELIKKELSKKSA